MLTKFKRLPLGSMGFAGLATASLFVAFFGQQSIVVSEVSYKCRKTGCPYQVTVKNISSQRRAGFLRLNAFRVRSSPKASSEKKVGSQRIDLKLDADEKKEIQGFIPTSLPAYRLQVSVREQ